MLRDYDGHVLKDESRQIESLYSDVESLYHDCHYASDLRQKVLVIARYLGPPRRDICAQGKSYEVVELWGEFWGDIGGREEGRRGRSMEEEAVCERGRHAGSQGQRGGPVSEEITCAQENAQ